MGSDLFLRCFSFFLLFVNFSDDCLDLVCGHHLLEVLALDHDKFDALFAFNDFEEGLDTEADSLLFGEAFLEVLFEEFTELFGLLADGVCLPLRHGTRWFCLVNLRSSILETAEEAGDTEWANSALLSVLLLSLSDKASNVFDCWSILIGKSEALALKSRLVDEHASVCLKS